MIRIGLKLWSTNQNYVELAKELYSRSGFDYIELFVVPGTTDQIPVWKQLAIPYVLHAPHSRAGMNLSVGAMEKQNRALLIEVDSFRQALCPRNIIFHPGVDGQLDECCRQISVFVSQFRDLFAIGLMENMPGIGLSGEQCVGASPVDAKKLSCDTGLAFCLDIRHAFSFAATQGADPYEILSDFAALSPKLWHLSDGNTACEKDQHLHLGHGDMDLPRILSWIPEESLISVETPKDSPVSLGDFEDDVTAIRRVLDE